MRSAARLGEEESDLPSPKAIENTLLGLGGGKNGFRINPESQLSAEMRNGS